MNSTNKEYLLKVLLLISLAAIVILLYLQLSQAEKIGTENINKPATLLSNSDSNKIQKIDPWIDFWDTDSHFKKIQEEMDQLMKKMLPGESIFSQHGFGLSTFSPSVNINENKEEYEVKVEVPEGEEMEFRAEIVDNTLKITGKTKKLKKVQADNSIQKSFSSSQFLQSLLLDKKIDEAGMTIEQNKNEFIVKIPKN